MSESKDIRKLEIPDNLFEEYAQLLPNHNIPKFWGGFVKYLIDSKKANEKEITRLSKEIEELEQELEIRTEGYKHNKVTEGIEALQDAGFSVELHFRERKNG